MVSPARGERGPVSSIVTEEEKIFARMKTMKFVEDVRVSGSITCITL